MKKFFIFFLHLINTLNNTIENTLCFLCVGHPIKFLLKRMQHSAHKLCLFFLCLASGKGFCRSSLKTLYSVEVYVVLTDVTFSEPNKMGSNSA